jgi:PAS domain S-box-containing protein
LLEELFEPLTDNPFFVKDADFRYVAANRAMLDLCGVRYRSELIGCTARDIYAPADAARYEMEERNVLAGIPITDRVEEVRAARRPPVWLILSQRLLRDTDGTPIGVVGVSRAMRSDFASDARFEGFAVALHVLRERFDRPLNCSVIARAAGLSVSQLERDFTKVLGVTPRLYQQRLRMEEALRLLLGAIPIADVALMSGFSDQSSFSRRFKLFTGMTPSAYRAAHMVNSA